MIGTGRCGVQTRKLWYEPLTGAMAATTSESSQAARLAKAPPIEKPVT